MKTAIITIAALIVGVAIGYLIGETTIRHLRKRLRELRAGKAPVSIFQSVTKFLFVTAQVFAIVWVSVSYCLAIYATVELQQAFPVTELSQQAIITIIGAMALKVVENIFEHNEGVVFGRSPRAGDLPGEIQADEASQEEAAAEETEGRG